MKAQIARVKQRELFEVYEKKQSLDKYVALRARISHQQALEVLAVGNISTSTYFFCIDHGEEHEDILDFADSRAMKKRAFSLTPGQSVFDDLVKTYVGPGVSLKDAFMARMFNIPNGSSTYKEVPNLQTVLQYTTIENLVNAWQQLTPRMNERTFLRYVAAGVDPEAALKLLHH